MTTRETVITGGGSGIGAASARLLARSGHAVCLADRDPDRLAAVAQEIRAGGGSVATVTADTSLEADARRIFDTARRELGPVTGLLNNAGIFGPRGRFDALELADIKRVFDVNVIGYFLCAREAVRRMSTRHGGQGGVIVNISSGAASHGTPGIGVLYSSTKGAINTLTAGLSQEVAGEGIRVNAVSPGRIATRMPTPQGLEATKTTVPMGRPGQPDEIAEAVLWLMSDQASYVAGANIRVAGGWP
jgi:NAD(P)-dependent dehydrogenase (short-subunit alcohol dehydrogenase family)